VNEDLRKRLNCLKSHGVEFLVIGSHAVGFHSRPRMTKDIDLWAGRPQDLVDVENLKRYRST
jgi:predicted nucleotidyltransferase